MERPTGTRGWAAGAIGEEAHQALASSLAPSAVWSLLLDVFERRASRRTGAELARQWKTDGFTRPSPVDPRVMNALDATLLEAASAFEAVELSPLAPLGSCSRISLGSQNRVVSALRGTEVVADPTNVMALECARRLREQPDTVVRLATSHRCVRAQPLPKGPGFARHFRIFCLASGARERRDHGFTVAALVEQIATWKDALSRLGSQGYAFPGARLTLLAAPGREELADRVAGAIAGLPVARAALSHHYYDGLRFTISMGDAPASGIPLIDGGRFDWLARLGSNRRHVFVASGMGSQLAAALFRRSSASPDS